MTEKEEKTEEKTEETPKNADDMTTSARAIIASLRDMEYSKEEAIAILAIASALVNGEVFMSILIENATIFKVPVNTPGTQKPSMN